MPLLRSSVVQGGRQDAAGCSGAVKDCVTVPRTGSGKRDPIMKSLKRSRLSLSGITLKQSIGIPLRGTVVVSVLRVANLRGDEGDDSGRQAVLRSQGSASRGV